MGSLIIKDTGFFTADRQGNQLTNLTNIYSLEKYVANGGNAITLKTGTLTRKSGLNVSDDPNPSSNDVARVHFVSFANAIYEIDHYVDVSNATEGALLKEILVLDRTKGLKLLYNSDNLGNIKSLPEIIGRVNTNFNTSNSDGCADNPVIIGKVIGTSLRTLPTSRKFQIVVTITFEEDKV